MTASGSTSLSLSTSQPSTINSLRPSPLCSGSQRLSRLRAEIAGLRFAAGLFCGVRPSGTRPSSVLYQSPKAYGPHKKSRPVGSGRRGDRTAALICTACGRLGQPPLPRVLKSLEARGRWSYRASFLPIPASRARMKISLPTTTSQTAMPMLLQTISSSADSLPLLVPASTSPVSQLISGRPSGK